MLPGTIVCIANARMEDDVECNRVEKELLEEEKRFRQRSCDLRHPQLRTLQPSDWLTPESFSILQTPPNQTPSSYSHELCSNRRITYELTKSRDELGQLII